MRTFSCDCVVIGAGPGGYVAAIRAAQLGLVTALVTKKEDDLGGTCLNRGCIPSKALIDRAKVWRSICEARSFGITVQGAEHNFSEMKRQKDQVVQTIRQGLKGLIASNKIHVFSGHGRFRSPSEVVVEGEESVLIQAKKIIIATGSEPRQMSHMPVDNQKIHDSTSFLNLTTLPKRLLVIGGGVIGCEFASLYQTLEVQVTILELLPTILSTEGAHISEEITRSFKKQGVVIETGCQVDKVEATPGGVRALLTGGRTVEADIALVSVGRTFNSSALDIDKAGVFVAKNGTIPTNEKMETNVPSIYAIGDVTGKWLLAHVASHQGLIAADNAAGISATMHYQVVPSVVFTYPEAASVGYTLEKALDAGMPAAAGRFPFRALGKAQASGHTDGFGQLVIDQKTGQILGAQVVGYEASNLIAEMVVAIQNELLVQSIGESIHPHPTLSEIWTEAAWVADGKPLHLPPTSKKT